MMPPVAKKAKHNFLVNNKLIEDDYHWMRSSRWPEKVDEENILNHLQAENDYFHNFMKPFANLKNELVEELKSRIKLSDHSTYVKKDNYYYYHRTEESLEYPIYCRKEGSSKGEEVIILDVNEIAKGKKFTSIGEISISPDHNLMAYSVDFAGDERYTIKIYDLKKKVFLKDEIPGTSGTVIWHENQSGFFYNPLEKEWRCSRVQFHKLGDTNADDKLIFKEEDHLFSVNIYKSSSKNFLFIKSGGYDRNSLHYIDVKNNLDLSPKLIKPKKKDVRYSIDHDGTYFYLKTNENAQNFCILRSNESFSWEEYIAHTTEKYLSSFSVTKDFMLLNYRYKGLPNLVVLDKKNQKEKSVTFPDAAYTASIYTTNFFENDIRVNYSSLSRPKTIYQYDFASSKMSVLKIQEIPSGFNSEEYQVERIFAEYDNVKVPISLVYKKSLFNKDGSNPLYLYGYGSYGIAIDPSFRNSAISLIDRGFVFAIAHIRGGDDLGRDWYESAKFLTKKSTFSDFIVAAKVLCKEKYTKVGNIIIAGGSAGGMLIGNVINECPQLFRAAIAHVPFVDVLNTMLDEKLPLTPGEFKEWGNPKEEKYFDYIKSYSPYENIKAQNYPHVLVTVGLSDPRVGYWEAAKWVAKLREFKTDNNALIFKTNMNFGHQGASGRFDYLQEVAEDLLFAIVLLKTS
ncbi:MAG TPA: S9 family peptidase [Candidatus Megaira endosymbiont of Nemacystus decipiens]|nr:S9 family peptidase [Candidatus Megaera endosymbiont of Nemacystus decipiens]